MTNLKLPKPWEKFINNDFIFGTKITKIGRFEIYQDDYSDNITIYDFITGESWSCDCQTYDLDVKQEIKKAKKIIKDYLTLGKQLKLQLKSC